MKNKRFLAAAVAAGLILGLGARAHARTAAGTVITNIALGSVAYSAYSSTPIINCSPPMLCSATPTGSATVFVLATCSTEFSVVKELIDPAPVSGGPVGYRIVVTNNSSYDTATNLVVFDTVSPTIVGVTTYADPVFPSPAMTQIAGSGTLYVWDSPVTMSPGMSFTFTISGFAGLVCSPVSVTNTAYVEIYQDAAKCTVTLYSNSTSVVIPTRPTGLSAGMVQLPANPGLGEAVTYYINVMNTETATLSQFLIRDFMPSSVTVFTAEAPTGFNLSVSGSKYEWSASGPSFAKDRGFSITITGAIAHVCATTAVSNSAYVWGSDGCSSADMMTGQVSTTVQPGVPGISVAKTQSPASPTLGNPVSYRIVVSNIGTETITDLRVIDTVSPVIAGAVASQPVGCSLLTPVSVGGGTRYEWVCSATQLVPSAAFTFTVSGTVGEVCVQTDVSNTAFVIAGTPCGLSATMSMSSSAPKFTVTAPILNFTVDKTQTPANPGIGETVTYRIVVTNSGEVTVENFSLTDTVSPVVRNVTTQQPTGFGAPAVTQLTFPETGTRYVWSATGLSFIPGLDMTFTMTGRMGLVCAPTQVSNTAIVTAGNSCAERTVQSGAVGSTVAPPTALYSVALEQDPASPALVPTSGTVTYRIIVTNNGSATIDDLVVVDTISAVLTSVTTDKPSAMPAPSIVGTRYLWNGANIGLTPGTSWTFSITGTVLDCGAANISNTACITARTACQTTPSRTMTGSVVFSAECIDISVFKQQVPTSPATANPGDPVTYRVVVTNIGGVPITDLHVIDTVPAEIVGVTTSQPGGFALAPLADVVPTGTRYQWDGVGVNMAPGQSYTFTMTGAAGTVCSPAPISNQAIGHGVRSTLNVYRSSSAVSLSIQPPSRSAQVSAQVSPIAPAPGQTVTYRIVVANTGTMTITSVTLYDTISPVIVNASTSQPVGFGIPTVTSVPGSGSVYAWSAGSVGLAPGRAYTFTITGQAGLACGTNPPAETFARAWLNDPCNVEYSTNEATTSFPVTEPPTSLTVVTTQTPASPNTADQVTYRIVVTNAGAATITSLVVMDTVSPVLVNVAVQRPGIFTQDVYQTGGTLYVWSQPVLSMGPGQSYTFTLTGRVSAVCAPTYVGNTPYAEAVTACVPLRQQSGNGVSFTAPAPAIQITAVKTQSPLNPKIGGDIAYRLVVTNTGAVTINNMLITDTISAGIVNVVSQYPSPSWTYTKTASLGSLLTWSGTGIDMGPGKSLTFTVTGQVGILCGATYVGSTAFIVADNSCMSASFLSNHVGVTIQGAVPAMAVTKGWVNKLSGTTTPLPGMGGTVRYTITAANLGTGTAYAVQLIDTIPTQYGQILWNEPLVGWTSSMTAQMANGSQIWTFSRSGAMGPGATAEPIVLDFRIFNLPVGGFVIDNSVQARFENPCTGQVMYSAVADAKSIAVEPPITMTIRVFNAAGELVRTFPPVQVGQAPDEMELLYAADPTLCGTVLGDSALPLSPDNDCVNDIVRLVFPDLIMEDGSFFDDIYWDGKNDNGDYVANGVYQIVASSVDTQSGQPVSVESFVTVFGKRTEVTARIYNAAGEEVAVLDATHIMQPVARIDMWPNPFEPLVKPYVSLSNEDDRNLSKGVAYIRLLDEQGREITSLKWYGRTCPSSPDHICQVLSETPAPAEDRLYLQVDGQIVNNGVYLVVVTSMDPAGGETRATATFTVSHGKLSIVDEVKAVPNPVSQTSLAAGRVKVWVRYEVASGMLSEVKAKVYNVAGELVTTFDATYQGAPADPLGLAADSSSSCPAGATCGTFAWDGKNRSGKVCASGLYVIVIEARDSGGNLQRETVKIAIQ